MFVKKIIIYLIVLMLFLSAGGHLIWIGKQTNPFRIHVIDYNVPATKIDSENNLNLDYRNHFGLFWILNNRKLSVDGTSELGDYKKDYYGPILDYKKLDFYTRRYLPDKTDTADIVYITDLYVPILDMVSGFTAEEQYNVISMQEKNALLIGEFNVFDAISDGKMLSEFEQALGVGATGWKGRYFDKLDGNDDTLKWLRNLYITSTKRNWNYSGDGYVLFSSMDEIVVLQEGIDFQGKGVCVNLAKGHEGEMNAKQSYYYGWFDIVVPAENSDVIAEFDFELTNSGSKNLKPLIDEKLISEGGTFPAIIRQNQKNRRSYYFSGNFSDMPEMPITYVSEFASAYMKSFTLFKVGDNSKFFWNFYQPVMNAILDHEAYIDIN